MSEDKLAIEQEEYCGAMEEMFQSITQEKRKSYLEVWTRDVGNSNSRRKVIHLPFKYELSNGETGNGSHLTEENALEIMSHGEVELRYSKKDEYLVDELNKMGLIK